MDQIRIHVEGENGDERLPDLYNWAAADPELRAEAALALRSAPLKPGEMGGVHDTVLATVNSAGAVTAALAAVFQVLFTWRATRRASEAVVVEAPGVTYRYSDADGGTVEITGTSTEDVLKVLREHNVRILASGERP